MEVRLMANTPIQEKNWKLNEYKKSFFKRRATALLSCLDCITTLARLGFRRRIYFSRTEQNAC